MHALAATFRQRQLLRGSLVIASVVAGAGVIVLIGWLFDIPTLKGIAPGFVTMKSNTALAFVVMGAAVTHLHRSASATSRLLIRACGSLVLLLSMLTLAEYATG